MAASTLSKVVTDYGKAARDLVATLRAHGPSASEKTRAFLAPVAKKGESVPDVGFLLELLARRLERAAAEMEAADKAHTDELSDDADPRRRRDEASEALRGVLLDVKRTLQTLFGENVATAFKVPAELSRDSAVVQRAAADIAKTLEKKKLPKPAVEGVKKVDSAPWVATIKKVLKRLDAASKDVAREAGEAQVTLVAKNRALDAFEAAFGAAAAAAWGLLIAAGEKEHASRISITPRRASSGGDRGRARAADESGASEDAPEAKPE